MKRKLRSPRRGNKRDFILSQMLPMRPYIVQLMDALRANRIRQSHLRRLARKQPHGMLSYEQRRLRYQAEDELESLRREEQQLLRDFKRIGIWVGDILRGEMLFPCRVDSREAYFIWFDGQERPTHWRFRDESESRPIPDRWFAKDPCTQPN